ncbi:MAG TPA: CDP-archaeol synthase [Lamprocystis sp. (in: g-proteobacteria)]|nr:CDP-archaeol synthase [Lamprocystis sp. (in: g-proteobacteria)]
MSSDWGPLLTLIVLLVLANGGPALLALLVGRAGAAPIDGGRVWRDGYPVFGPSKTWRGLAAALLLTPVAAWALGCGWVLGVMVALAAMAGDLLVSFTKRRMRLLSGTSVPVVDQLPEALIPALLARPALGLDWLDLALAVGAFVALNLVLTPVGKWFAGPDSGRTGR